ncbi:hypothetical protein CK203_051842 [Vitis vinifera]|uniref:Uncharacterized protein n=1 Tax=Vitis vinifera TaxID=29760 RepID=A0A438GUS7_VITVI|nr:hypothetical protein CK203_051842 [Vitis vinifera]
MKNPSFGALQNPCQNWKGLGKAISSKIEENRAFRKAKSSISQGMPKFGRVCQILARFTGQTPSEDDFSEDEWLSFMFLGVMEASNLELCMPYWIRDIEGRLMKIETPQETKLEVCLNIMDCPPEDQHSQHGINGLKRKISNISLRRMRNSMSVGRGTWKLSTLVLTINFDTWLLVSYFYDGVSSSMKQLLDTMCGGDFMSKNPEEAMDFLSYASEVSREWDEPNTRDVGRMKSQPNAKGGMYVLSKDMDMKAKFATMARRLE